MCAQPTFRKLLHLLFFSFLISVCYSSDVLDLGESDFDSKLKDQEIALVEFFAPWCGHCKRLAPEYEQAATALKNSVPPVPLVKVDCTVHTNLCSRFGVSGYPTLKIFKHGEFSAEYQGPREADGIIKFMRSKAGPSSRHLKSQEDFDKLLLINDPFVVGVFTSDSSELFKVFKQTADILNEDFVFAHSLDADINAKIGHSDAITVVLPKSLRNKFEDSVRVYSGDDVHINVRNWIEQNIFGLVGHRTTGNQKYFSQPLVIAYFDVDYERNAKGTNYWRNRVMKVAKKHRDAGAKLNFAISSSKQLSHEMAEFGVESPDDKKVYVVARDAQGKKLKMTEEFSMETLDKFIQDVLDNKLEPYLKSEPLPDNQDAPVKVAVAKNFNDLVNDPNKDVLIEFYAPWCGHCKSLAPKYDELAAKLEKEPEIAIVKMDATANDVPAPYDVKGFPTLYFVPRNDKKNPKQYNGGREVADMLSYIAKESTNPLKGFDRSGNPAKSEL